MKKNEEAEAVLLTIKKRFFRFYKEKKIFLLLSSFYEEQLEYSKAIRVLEAFQKDFPELFLQIKKLREQKKLRS